MARSQQKQHAGELVRAVRDSTRRFQDVNQAKAEGYQLLFGCVSGPDDGAMGLHYVNMELVGDGVLDPRRPEIVIYEPLPNGGRRLIGADFLVFAEAWHASNTGTPELGGQLMHLIESPNRYGLPAFYTLHVWAWKPNPTGAFVNWHSDVSCEQFDGRSTDMPAAIYRTAAFLFSIVCYGVFLLVFLYLLAFLGNLQATPIACWCPLDRSGSRHGFAAIRGAGGCRPDTALRPAAFRDGTARVQARLDPCRAEGNGAQPVRADLERRAGAAHVAVAPDSDAGALARGRGLECCPRLVRHGPRCRRAAVGHVPDQSFRVVRIAAGLDHAARRRAARVPHSSRRTSTRSCAIRCTWDGC